MPAGRQETKEFIRSHREDDVRQLALSEVRGARYEVREALVQISGWQSARRKIPSWAAIEDIIYPQHISMEQCSSDRTAEYKARVLLERCEERGASFVDLTGGLGVDFVAIAKSVGGRSVYVERSEELCEIARNNFPLLGVEADIVCTTAEEYLHEMEHVNLLFVDPARRDGIGRKMVGISDCTPDILSLKDEMLSKADVVMIKLSPMLDWHKAVADLGECVSEVHIVSVGNECKELLLVVRGSGGAAAYGERVGAFLYEPNASIMKSGCFGALCSKYGVSMIGKNSHLFVSDVLIENFPGRKFVVEAMSSMNKRDIREKFGVITKANVAVRNFPMSADELRRRLKLTDGGDAYVFGTTLADGSHCLLLCKKC